MPAAIPIIAAVAAGAAAASGMYIIAGVITIAASVAAMAMTKKPSFGGYRDQAERKQVLRAAASAKTVVYGQTLTSGTLFFSEEQPGDQDDGELLFLAITLAGHPLSRVGKIWLADDEIGTYGSHAQYEVHTDRQTADPYLLKNAPSWKPDMIGRGITWLRLTLAYNAEKFPSGIPNVRVEKFGREVYDPRTGNTSYSNNLALCVLDYYRNYLKVPDSDINWEQFKIAANICDETVTNGDGTIEKRYTLNGEFDLSENKSAILEAMLAAGAADPTYIAGKHGILVGAYYGPATEVITESQVAGDIEIMPEVSQSERVNTVRGTFTDPKQMYSEVDFPAVSVKEWVVQDGVEIPQDMKLRFVTSEFQAQRLADIKLKRTRIARTMNVPLNLSGYRYRPGMYVKVNFPTLGIVGVEMRVTDWKFGINNGVMLTLKQETSDVWGDAVGKPIDRPPFTQLPPGGVAQPQNLRYTVEEIGQIVQGVLSWHNIGQVSYNKIIIKRDNISVLSVQVPGSFTRLSGLVRGNYTAHVIAVNAMGGESPEAYLPFSISAPDKPASVAVESGYFSVTLTPKMTELTSVSTQFDFWTSGEKKLSNTNTSTVESGATRTGIGMSWTRQNLQVEHTYYWYVRSVNAFGASDFVEVAAKCQMDIGDTLELLNGKIDETHLGQELSGKLGTISDNQEALARASLEAGLQIAETRQELDRKSASLATDINGVRDELVAADKHLKDRVDAVTGGSDVDIATVVQQIDVISDEQQKQATRFDAVVAQSDGNTAQIAKEELARTDGDKALAQEISSVKTTMGENSGAITELKKSQADIDSALAQTSQSLEALARADIEGALKQEGDTQAQREVSAKLTTQQTVLADEQSAQARRLTQFDTKYGDSTAKLQEETKTLSQDGKALSEKFNSLDSKVDQNAATAREQTQAVATDLQAEAQRVTDLQTDVDGNTAAIQRVDKAQSEGDKALGLRIDSVNVETGKNAAAITQIQNAQSDLQGSSASNQTSLEALARADLESALKQHDDDSAQRAAAARIDTKQEVQATEMIALARDIKVVSAELGDTSAKVQQNIEAVTELNGKLSASWSVRVEVDKDGNPIVAGLGLGVDGEGNSQFLVYANRFAIISNTGGKSYSPFVVEDNQAFFNSAFFKKASIDFAVITDTLQSDGYQPGKPGWALRKSGEFDISSGDGAVKIDGNGFHLNIPGVVKIDIGRW